MPKGENLKGKKMGNNFAIKPQPSPKAKSDGRKRIGNIKEAINFMGKQLRSIKQINGEDIEFTFESNIAFELIKKANEGDLNAIKIYSDWMGLNKPQKSEIEILKGAKITIE